jgi:hypothetical protein
VGYPEFSYDSTVKIGVEMRLVKYENRGNYKFYFKFDNQESGEVDISNLIKKYVTKDELSTARIDKEWGCLEFKNSMVDIEPKHCINFLKIKLISKKISYCYITFVIYNNYFNDESS